MLCIAAAAIAPNDTVSSVASAAVAAMLYSLLVTTYCDLCPDAFDTCVLLLSSLLLLLLRLLLLLLVI